MTFFAPGGSLRLQQSIWQRRCIQRCTRTFRWRGGAVHERGLAGWRLAAVSPMFGFSLESTKNFGPLNLQQGRGRVGSPGRLLSFQGYHHLFILCRLQWRPLFPHCRCVPEPPFSAAHASVFCCSGWIQTYMSFHRHFNVEYSPVEYRSHCPCDTGLLLCVFKKFVPCCID